MYFGVLEAAYAGETQLRETTLTAVQKATAVIGEPIGLEVPTLRTRAAELH